MLILYFHIFQGGFEVLNVIFQVSVYVTIITAILYYNMYICTIVRKIFHFLLVFELLIYSKDHSLI